MAEEGPMEFNRDTREMLQFGKSNQGSIFAVNGRVLGNIVVLSKSRGTEFAENGVTGK